MARSPCNRTLHWLTAERESQATALQLLQRWFGSRSLNLHLGFGELLLVLRTLSSATWGFGGKPPAPSRGIHPFTPCKTFVLLHQYEFLKSWLTAALRQSHSRQLDQRGTQRNQQSKFKSEGDSSLEHRLLRSWNEFLSVFIGITHPSPFSRRSSSFPGNLKHI